MKGYKSFSKGFTCDGKQYVEDTVYEDPEGILFYQNPLIALTHCRPIDKNGELNEFAEVEILDEIKTAEDACYTRKLKIGKKLSLAEFAPTVVSYTFKKEALCQFETGNHSVASNTGDSFAAAGNSKLSVATNTGWLSVAANTGDFSVAASTGDSSTSTSTGNNSTAISTSYHSIAANAGECSTTANTGGHSAAINTGDSSAAASKGDFSLAANTGYQSAATNSGYCSAAIAIGYGSTASVEGTESIAFTTAKGSKAKGSLGCWLVVAERDEVNHIVSVVSAKVDGVDIKPDTFYIAKNGKLVEASSDANSGTTSFFR